MTKVGLCWPSLLRGANGELGALRAQLAQARYPLWEGVVQPLAGCILHMPYPHLGTLS